MNIYNSYHFLTPTTGRKLHVAIKIDRSVQFKGVI